jgi:hypothetical protein
VRAPAHHDAHVRLALRQFLEQPHRRIEAVERFDPDAVLVGAVPNFNVVITVFDEADGSCRPPRTFHEQTSTDRTERRPTTKSVARDAFCSAT